MAIILDECQLEAISKMHNGCILCGDVGSGKSRTGIAYFFLKYGGCINPYRAMKKPPRLIIITTAKKRDSKEWEGDLCHFLISDATVDSWNNIEKYKEIKNAFFIFDEQRVIGSGTWVKSFLRIAKSNEWILLTATPGDAWIDYVPVFVANGYYKNRTEFIETHVEYSPFTKFRTISKYHNTRKLERLRDNVLVDIDYKKQTVRHVIDIWCDYNLTKYKETMRKRWDYEKQVPIETASELCYALRKIVNSSDTRLFHLLEIIEERKKLILFYNFDYELDAIKECLTSADITFAEWNGHKHQDVPTGSTWVYLVNYIAGAEGWNCIRTDTTVFYSQSYSYKTMVQASGRIDRRNTPFIDLYYYHFKSHAPIDLAIAKALKEKKKFNESRFVLS